MDDLLGLSLYCMTNRHGAFSIGNYWKQDRLALGVVCGTIALQAMAIGDWALLNQLSAWGFSLTPEQKDQLRSYLEHLYRANQQFNLTRVPPEQAVGRHILDSLCLLTVARPFPNTHLIDVGSGAGLPGIPLKIVCPEIALTLLDSHGKTVQFLRAVCEVLGIKAQVVQARAEEYAHQAHAREQFDWVVARAVAKMPLLAELLVPFARVAPESRVLALKSQQEYEEVRAAEPAVRLLGGVMRIEAVSFESEQGTLTRLIVEVRKVSPTPPAYPRRWSQILKQPL